MVTQKTRRKGKKTSKRRKRRERKRRNDVEETTVVLRCYVLIGLQVKQSKHSTLSYLFSACTMHTSRYPFYSILLRVMRCNITEYKFM